MKRFLLLCFFLSSCLFSAYAAYFTVTSNLDNGAGSLRAAITSAASTAGAPHTVTFASAMTINLLTTLQIGNNANLSGITINGFVDATAGPDIIIRSTVNFNNTGFEVINANNVKIYGIVFQNLEYGIRFHDGCVGGEVKGCYFGSNKAGSAIQDGLQKSGVFLLNNCSNISIGGTGLISGSPEGNLFVGCMRVYTGAGAGSDFGKYGALLLNNICNGNTIAGNIFGTDVNGNTTLTNGQNADRELPLGHHNIYINFSTGNTIAKNLISGATGVGIYITGGSNNTIIKGNKVGINKAATGSIPNKAAGIYIEGSSNCIVGFSGGNIEDERNIISGNGGALHNNYDDNCNFGWNDFNQYGIFCKNSSNSTFKGNYIGTDLSGMNNGIGNSLANRAGGIKIVSTGGSSKNNVIGGQTADERNVISGNGYTGGGGGSSTSCANYNPSGTTGGPGITLQYQQTQNNVISGNYIGVAADGITALGNGQEGVNILGAENNIVGGLTSADANIICNNLWGVLLDRDFGSGNNPSSGNQIIGNYIGINKDGVAMGNGLKTATDGGGVCLRVGANKNYIGTAVDGGGNIISGNRSGIVFQTADDGSLGKGPAHNNFVYNNKIGTNATGTLAIPNTFPGGPANAGNGIVIEIGSAGTRLPFHNTIGGNGNFQKNIISGNQQDGIYVFSKSTTSGANSIIGNIIGLNATGDAIIANGTNGININAANGNTISSNTISGNKAQGIRLDNADSTLITSNKIGTDPAGLVALKNNNHGISLSNGASANIIGGNKTTGGSNIIANNGGNGINVDGAASVNNAIHQNSISCNTNRGIVLSNGGNNNYAAPIISGNKLTMTITGNAGSYIELFETDGCADCPKGSTSNRLQGKTLVASGFSPLTYSPADGKLYTATASADSTVKPHNTSEFSVCYSLCTPPDAVSVVAKDTTSFCDGGKVLLSVNISGGVDPFTYVWKSNGTVIKDSVRSAFTATTSGSYSILVLAGAGFCSTESGNAMNVAVYPNPPKPVITGSPAEFCAGSTGKLSATGTGTFTWFKGGTVAGSTNPLTVTTAGKYVVIIKSDKNCSSPVSDTTLVIVNPNPPKPAVSTNDPKTFCEGLSAIIKSTGTGTFNWYNNGIDAGTGDSIVVKSSGKFTVVVTSAKNCSSPASDTVSILVNPTPSKPLVQGNPSAFCEGSNGKLTATVTGANATATGIFQWYLNGAAISKINPFLVTLPGKYTIIVTSDKNCSSPASDTILVTVNPNPVKPIIKSSGPTNFCDGLSDDLIATSATAQVKFQWYKDGSKIGTDAGQATAFKATQAGKYTVIATTDKNCSSPAADTIVIIVYPIPKSPTIKASQTSFCPGYSADLTAIYTGIGMLQWFKDNVAFETKNPVTVKEGGAYTITIKSPEGCTSPASAATMITVLPPDPNASIIKDHEQICDHFLALSASNPKGIWKLISGAGKFDDATIPSTTIRDLADGKNIIIWDISAAPYTCIPVKLIDTLNLKVGLDSAIAIKAEGPEDTLCIGNLRTLKIKVLSGGSGDFTYHFSAKNYTKNSGIDSLKFGPVDEETFFSVVVTDNKFLGCSSNLDTFTVHSIGKQELYIPNLITPNADNKNDKFIVFDQKKRRLDPEGSTLEIYNRWGHNVFKDNRYENTWTAEGLADGVYFYHLKAGCGGNSYKSWVEVVSNSKYE